jgi:hypothetical protein
VKGLGGKTEVDKLKNPGGDKRMILKWIFKK